jgi:hypothetical protein
MDYKCYTVRQEWEAMDLSPLGAYLTLGVVLLVALEKPCNQTGVWVQIHVLAINKMVYPQKMPIQVLVMYMGIQQDIMQMNQSHYT